MLAGAPLRLLEDEAGLKVAEVTEILRQQGDYKKAADALSQGRTAEGFEELDRLGWIKQVNDDERYVQLANAYLAATREKKGKGEYKTALVVSPTHAEADRITAAIRTGLTAQEKLSDERVVNAWVCPHLTDAEKSDPRRSGKDKDLVQLEAERVAERRKVADAEVAKRESQLGRRALPVAVHLGTMRPVWLTGADGEDHLLFAFDLARPALPMSRPSFSLASMKNTKPFIISWKVCCPNLTVALASGLKGLNAELS